VHFNIFSHLFCRVIRHFGDVLGESAWWNRGRNLATIFLHFVKKLLEIPGVIVLGSVIRPAAIAAA
jgi:hypothetical protein